MDKERYIFEKFRSKFNGDDCAVIGERAYCKDLFVEGVHFRRGWLSLREIGAKAMLVNISDMIATNARAKYALLGLALPREIGTREIDELCAGVSETAREWGIRIIGGDTIGSDRIALSVSLIGKCKRPVFRSGARVGDLIAHTGELGGVGRDLVVLLRDEISSASSQMQNRNDKISSLQSSSTAPQGLNAETSTAQNFGDEVRSPGDKISPARVEPPSLDAETSAMQILDLEPQSLDDKISPAYVKPQSLDAETSAMQILDLEPQSLDDKIFPAYIEPQSLDAETSAQNSTAENSTRNFTPQNLGVGNSAAQESQSAGPTAQNSAANSAPQSPAYKGSVFDLREDLRAKISKNSRFVRPVLRDKFFYKAAKFVSAAMDISDGLAQDLPRLLEASGVGARWIARPSEAAMQSGEEYEILFSFAPKFLPKIYAIAAKTGVAINIIAEVCPRTPQSSMEFLGKPHHFAP